MILRALSATALCLPLFTLHADDFLPAKSLGDPALQGKGIQRTMSLLADSTPEHRNAVKILFYGQSITEQAWATQVGADLKKRFPDALLTIENRAIGGHSSQLLHRTAEADLYPFYPDLVIFHVYGAHNHYEDIIRRIRQRTTAEILLQTDHMAANDKPDEPTAPDTPPSEWNSFMNYNFLPSLAAQYRTGLVDQRNLWKQYLRDHSLPASALLRDGVHLNENGCHLMAAIVSASLVKRPDADPATWENLVREIPAPAPREGALTLEFTGNRIDARQIPSSGASVLIDGKPVSAHPGVHAFTRTSGYNGTNWPCLLKVDRGPASPRVEEWTITLQDANDDYTSFRFSLAGSLTGPDGSGSSAGKFTSPSGRIVIQPEDWNLAYCRKVYNKRLPEDFKITWKSILTGTDILMAGDTLTLAQGLTNSIHTLSLTGLTGGAPGGFTVFEPPFPEDTP